MVAGFQHFLEGGIADASNATAKNVELMQRYGRDGLDISAHSRGTDTTGNAMQILLKHQKNIGVLSNTNKLSTVSPELRPKAE
jgi:filamentous hemagglutinin